MQQDKLFSTLVFSTKAQPLARPNWTHASPFPLNFSLMKTFYYSHLPCEPHHRLAIPHSAISLPLPTKHIWMPSHPPSYQLASNFSPPFPLFQPLHLLPHPLSLSTMCHPPFSLFSSLFFCFSFYWVIPLYCSLIS